MLALINDNTIISTVHAGGWFDLPDGSRTSPAQDGWTGGEYRLAAIQPAVPVPEGKRVVSTDLQMIDGQPRYVNVLEDIEPDTGSLTPEELRAQMPSLSRRQLLLALHNIGISEAYVDTLLIDDPEGMIEWKNAGQYLRTHPLIEEVAEILEITPEQIDTLWMWASEL